MTAPAFPTALVTGASRGIGAGIARRLARDGFAVAINYAARADDAQALAKEITQAGGRALALQADVSRADQVGRLFNEIEREWGGLDVLVNNAGILDTSPLAQASDSHYERTFAINTQGVFNTLREAGQRLRDGGRIINLSTSVLLLNTPGYACYAGSKAAVEAFTRIFAQELRGRHITVNAVAPGPVATDLFFAGKTDAQVKAATQRPPLERLGQPGDIAGVVAFLAGPDGAWVNGQIIGANGGIA